MREEIGWIKAYREWINDPIINKDPEYFSVWMFLQLTATHKSVTADFCGKTITLKPGQLITGRDAIARKTKVNSQKVERILKRLKSVHLIEQQTGNKGRLISLLNWDFEQKIEHQIEQPVNNKRTTNVHLQEDKNVKNGDKTVYSMPTLEDVRAYGNEINSQVDADKFFDRYQRTGWKINGVVISDWKAVFRSWDRREWRNNETIESDSRKELYREDLWE